MHSKKKRVNDMWSNLFSSFDQEIYDTVSSQPETYDILLNYTDLPNQSD